MVAVLDLPTVWAFILAFAVLLYVVMDGFDLGIGILFPIFRRTGTRHRDELHRARLGRQRDLAGARRRRADGGVSARLCDHHAGALRAAHRNVARSHLSRVSLSSSAGAIPATARPGISAFTVGSIVATLAQGITLGALLQGITVSRTAPMPAAGGTG